MVAPYQVDRYRILKLLGQGGMGKVYRAYDPDLDREVVLKFISLLDSGIDDEGRDRFLQEVRMAGSLNHPHIVTIYDVVLERESPYVVMEFLRGGNLKERLKQKLLSWQEAFTLLQPLVEALAYAHRAGIIHRDVKPENVMFAGNEANTLKLVDFGLARRQGGKGLTQLGAVIGTPAYMSPEQARGEIVDGRTDIFALGIILVEAMTGHNPLYKGSPFSTVLELASDQQLDLALLNDIVPPPVIRLIKKAIAKNRNERYSSCEILLSDIINCLGDQVESPKIPFSSPPLTGRLTRGPRLRVAGDIHLTAEVETVLRTMFSQFSQVAIEGEFGQGFSGSHVFRVRLVERGGRTQLPAVIKIAPIGLIQEEWRAYHTWVENTLPNIARIDGSPTFPPHSLWGGLRYVLVGGGTFTVKSLHEYYQEASLDDLLWILEDRLFQIMGQNWWWDNRTDRTFQMQTDYDTLLPINLLVRPAKILDKGNVYSVEISNISTLPTIAIGDQIKLKGFMITKVDPKQQQVTLNFPLEPAERPSISYRIRLVDVPDISHYRVGNIIDVIQGKVVATRHNLLINMVRQVLGETVDLSAERLPWPTHQTGSFPVSLPNPLLTYQSLLQNFTTVKISTIHGDLNLENILIDPATREVSLIDFATVRRGHALHDLLRLETDVVIRLVSLALAEAKLPLETLYSFYEQLQQTTLYPEQTASFYPSWPALKKPFKMLQAIRRMARKCLFNLDDWQEYHQGLILYLLGALKFASLQPLPPAPLPGQTVFWSAAVVQHLLETSPDHQVQRPEQRSRFFTTLAKEPIDEIESPFGTMRSDSKMYIEREVDQHCHEQINAAHAVTLFIQAPRQMGKSSLMRRVLEQAKETQQKPFVFIDFQKFPEDYFNEEDKFLVEFCLMIGEALGLPEAIDRYWQGRRTNIMKCSRYMSEYVIPHLNEPFILAMDEVERILSSPFRTNFFGMLRTWHNDRVYDENFAKLTLFLSSSTEPYLFIENPNQSPFNVAEVFSLQDFTRPEVEELNQRHHFPLTQQQVSDLMDLVNGHPFLTRLGLYLVATGKFTPDTLITQSAEDTGPFGDHLRYYLLRVLQKSELRQALTHICRHHAYPENQMFYRLKGAGLIKQEGKQVILRNRLYDRYFKERFNVRGN